MSTTVYGMFILTDRTPRDTASFMITDDLNPIESRESLPLRPAKWKDRINSGVMWIPLRFIALTWLVLMAACASGHHQPQPILERVDRPLSVGDPTASRDLGACRAEVSQGAPVTIQPRWLPPLGTTDSGVVLGTVDNPHPAWLSREAYRQALARCLVGRGYQILSWQ